MKRQYDRKSLNGSCKMPNTDDNLGQKNEEYNTPAPGEKIDAK